MGMLGLSRFGVLFKQQLSIPGFPKVKPGGYKPPKFFDPAREPGQRGFKLGTVRRWAEGPHIKTREGWFPYDAKKGKMQTPDGKWVDLPSDLEPKEEIREYPDPDVLQEALDVASEIQEDVKRGEKSEQEAYEEVGVLYEEGIALLEDIAENHPSERVAKKAASELKYWKKQGYPKNLDDMLDGFSNLMGDEDYTSIIEQAHKRAERRERKEMGAGKIASPFPDPVFQKMVSKPKSVSRLGGEESVNTVMVWESGDGVDSIFKLDRLGMPLGVLRQTLNPEFGSGVREAAAYDLDRFLGLDTVPPTVLVETGIPDEEIVEDAADSLATHVSEIDADEYMEDLEDEETLEGSMQLKLKGETFIDQYGHFSYPSFSDLGEGQQQDMIKIAVLDYITGNTDRHSGNIFVTDDGNIMAIDNGLSFPDPDEEFRVNENEFKSIAARIAKEQPIPDDVLERMGGIEEEEFKEVLHAYGMSAEAEGAWERLSVLLTTGTVVYR